MPRWPWRRRRAAEPGPGDHHFPRPLRQEGLGGLSLDDARPLLRARMVEHDELPGTFTIGAARPYAEGISAALVADLPDRLELVGEADLVRWGAAGDELLEGALAATRDDPGEPDVERQRNDEDAEVVFVRSPSPYTATEALWPDRHLDALGDHGAIVAVPNEGVAALHAITDDRVTGVLRALAPWSVRLYFLEPGSVSPHLYWWRPGAVERLPVKLDREAATLHPPAAFEALLERLGADTGR